MPQYFSVGETLIPVQDRESGTDGLQKGVSGVFEFRPTPDEYYRLVVKDSEVVNDHPLQHGLGESVMDNLNEGVWKGSFQHTASTVHLSQDQTQVSLVIQRCDMRD